MVGWWRTSMSSNRLERHMLRVLMLLMATHHFDIAPAYVRTYHNDLDDWLSRATKKEADEYKEKRGYTRVNLKKISDLVMSRGHLQRSLMWSDHDPEMPRVALQLMERRLARGPPRSPTSPVCLRGELAVGWGAVFGHYARAWQRAGGRSLVTTRQWARGREQWLLSSEEATFGEWDEKECPAAFFVTLAGGREGKDLEAMSTAVVQAGPTVLAFDFPRGAPVQTTLETLKRAGWRLHAYSALTTALGDATARKRGLVTGAKGLSLEEAAWWEFYPVRDREAGMLTFLEPAPRHRASSWLGHPGHTRSFIMDKTAGATRDPLLPRATGRVGRSLAYDPKHPAPTLRQEVLVLQVGGPGPGVRGLTLSEQWRAHSGSAEALRGLKEGGASDDDLLRLLRRAGAAGLATEVVTQVSVFVSSRFSCD